MDTFQLARDEWKQLQSKLREHLLDLGERVGTDGLNPLLDDLQVLFIQTVDTVSQKAGSIYLDLLWKTLMDSIPQCLDRKTELSLVLGLSRTYDITGHWSKALERYDQARTLAAELNEKELEADILRWMGHTHRKMGNWKESVKYNRDSLRICKGIGYYTGEAYADNNLGTIYFETGEWRKATEFFERALSISRGGETKRLVAQIYNNMGIIADTRGEIEKAILSYNTALPLYEKAGDMLGMAQTYYNLAISYKHKGESRLIQKHLERSADLSRNLGERSLLAMIYIIKAELALEKDDTISALSFKNFASGIFKELDDQLGIADTFRLEGRIYGYLGDAEKADASYQRSIRTNRDRNNLLGLACTCRDYGYFLGRRGNVKKAVKILRESLALYERFDAARMVENIKDGIKSMDTSVR